MSGKLGRPMSQKSEQDFLNILTKARARGSQPTWMGEEAWAGLLRY